MMVGDKCNIEICGRDMDGFCRWVEEEEMGPC